jgi:hypothetical protein
VTGVSKQLICPGCGQVMAAAVFRVFGGLRITMPDRVLLPPVTGHLLLTIAEQRLKSASAEQRLDFIVRNAGDRLYDIKCPAGHYTLKTSPEITRAIRRAAGDQVSLA